MSETGIKKETQDSDGVAKSEKANTEKEKEGKQRSVSFNRDVHVKRFGESSYVMISLWHPFSCNVFKKITTDTKKNGD